MTSAVRTIIGILATNQRLDLARQAIVDARREGYLDTQQEARLRRVLNRQSHDLAREVTKHQAIHSESKAS